MMIGLVLCSLMSVFIYLIATYLPLSYGQRSLRSAVLSSNYPCCALIIDVRYCDVVPWHG